MLKGYSYKINGSNFIQNSKIMKYFTYILIFLALILISINVLNLDFQNLFEGKSLIALIGIVAILCGVVLWLIFKMSKAIDEKLKKNS